jgi:CBS domain-containing protein
MICSHDYSKKARSALEKIFISDIHKIFGTKMKTLPLDATLEDAIRIFASETSLSGICLLANNENYAGMITRMDLLKWSHLQFTDGHGIHGVAISEYYRMIDARKAKDLVSRASGDYYVKESDTIQTALDKMIDSEEDIIPVLNAQGKILGDLRLSEILWFILRSG